MKAFEVPLIEIVYLGQTDVMTGSLCPTDCVCVEGLPCEYGDHCEYYDFCRTKGCATYCRNDSAVQNSPRVKGV